MVSLRIFFGDSTGTLMHAVAPLRGRWNSLDSNRRAQITLGAALVVLALIVAFVLLPALDARKALTARLPQMEAQLSVMRSQSKEVGLLGAMPAITAVPRTAANVALLQAIFGPGSQITATQDGFRVVLPSITYASWWDKTGDAISRHALLLREASITRLAAPAGMSTVAVDMRLGSEASAKVLPATSTAAPAK